MKTQILVTLEFDENSTAHNLSPSCQQPTRKLVLDDVSQLVRQWVNGNPYELRDRDSLSLKCELVTMPIQSPPPVALKNDLERIALDLETLSKLTRQVVR